MSDSVPITPGTGADIAVDDIGGRKFQRVKLIHGADGVNDGDVSAANPLPVALLGGATALEDAAAASGFRGVPVLAVRRDTMAPTADDGDYHELQINAAGRLKVTADPASQDATTGNITSNTGTLAINVERTSNISFHCVNAGVSGATFNWEASLNSTNGTNGNWFSVQAVQTNANTIGTSATAIGATPSFGWEASVNGYRWFRIRASAGTFGTSTWTIQPAPFATEPIPAAQVSATQPVSGTVTATLAAATTRAGFIAAPGIWYDDSSTALVANATFTGTARDATVTAAAASFANAGTYAAEVRACAESDVSGTLWLEVSRDNTNWRRIRSVATTAITGGGQAAELIYRPATRYWRIGYTNGATIQARFLIQTLATAA